MSSTNIRDWKKEFDEQFKHTDKNEVGYFPVYRAKDVKAFIGDLLSSHTQEVLEAYNDFLLKNNYTDADIYAEKPTAIERFLALK